MTAFIFIINILRTTASSWILYRGSEHTAGAVLLKMQAFVLLAVAKVRLSTRVGNIYCKIISILTILNTRLLSPSLQKARKTAHFFGFVQFFAENIYFEVFSVVEGA